MRRPIPLAHARIHRLRNSLESDSRSTLVASPRPDTSIPSLHVRASALMNGLWLQFTRREAHPVIQFVKYGLAGGAATVVDVLIFYTLSWKIFPALQADDHLVRLLRDGLGFDFPLEPVREALRGRRFILNSAIAFVFSNFTAYLLNMSWVFTPGRHRRHIEIILFYIVSVVSILSGIALGWAMITFIDLSTTASYLGKMIAAVLINYACRKYFVFKG